VDAPEAARLVHCPLQTALGAALADTAGLGLTVTVATAEAVAPPEAVPVTVYDVVVFGLTVRVDPEAPVFQVKFVPARLEVAFKVVVCPAQIVGLLTVTVIELHK